MLASGTFVPPRIERVHYGRPAAEVVAEEAGRLGATRVFLLASRTLNTRTDAIEQVRRALGNRCAGTHDDMPAHSPREAVIACARAMRAANADLLVTFGGGSVTDGGKVVTIALEHGVDDVDGLEPFRGVVDEKTGAWTVPEFRGPRVRQIAVPTTLSGGEFNPRAGITDTRIKRKQSFLHPDIVPRAIVLDGAATVHTPEWLFLSTGIRALDHCVEGVCSTRANPYTDGSALQGIRLLAEALPRVKRDPGDLEARQKCLIAAWLAMVGVVGGVPMGASHAIGHVLGGTADVPHGYTSCVMLPAVLAWNEGVNRDRQALVSAAMGRAGVPASVAVREFVAGLGLPGRLGDVGVGEDRFALVAQNAMHDAWTHTNPRPIAGAAEVLDILRLAA